MLFLLFADIPGLGRMSRSMLCDQDRVEMLFVPTDDRKSLSRGHADVCAWWGVQCDDSSNVTKIVWNHDGPELHGSIDFAMLPPLLTWIGIHARNVEGDVGALAYPEGLEYILLSKCWFSGRLDLSCLPKKLKFFFVLENQIQQIGTIANLPETLAFFHLYEKFVTQRSLRIGKLPESGFEMRVTVGFSVAGRFVEPDLCYEDLNDRSRVHRYKTGAN